MTEKKRAWARRAEKELRGRDPDGLTWQTPEGIAVQPVRTAKDSNVLFRKFISAPNALPLMAE